VHLVWTQESHFRDKISIENILLHRTFHHCYNGNDNKQQQHRQRKYENVAQEIKNIWKLTNVTMYPLVISVKEVVTKNFLKYLWNTSLTKNILKGGGGKQ
jgi:hypothetical protein